VPASLLRILLLTAGYTLCTWLGRLLVMYPENLASFWPGSGVGLAALLAWRRFPGRDLLDALLTAPLVLPPTVLGYYVLVALGRRSVVGEAWEDVFGSSIVFTRSGQPGRLCL
jgi:ABC-type sulfate transport system permease subunit